MLKKTEMPRVSGDETNMVNSIHDHGVSDLSRIRLEDPKAEDEAYLRDGQSDSGTDQITAELTPDSLSRNSFGRLICSHSRGNQSIVGESQCTEKWGKGRIAYRCRTCQTNDTRALCVNCFQNSDHWDHDYVMYYSESSGCCDCGDRAAWKESGCCSSGTHQRLNVPEGSFLELLVATFGAGILEDEAYFRHGQSASGTDQITAELIPNTIEDAGIETDDLVFRTSEDGTKVPKFVVTEKGSGLEFAQHLGEVNRTQLDQRSKAFCEGLNSEQPPELVLKDLSRSLGSDRCPRFPWSGMFSLPRLLVQAMLFHKRRHPDALWQLVMSGVLPATVFLLSIGNVLDISLGGASQLSLVSTPEAMLDLDSALSSNFPHDIIRAEYVTLMDKTISEANHALETSEELTNGTPICHRPQRCNSSVQPGIVLLMTVIGLGELPTVTASTSLSWPVIGALAAIASVALAFFVALLTCWWRRQDRTPVADPEVAAQPVAAQAALELAPQPALPNGHVVPGAATTNGPVEPPATTNGPVVIHTVNGNVIIGRP